MGSSVNPRLGRDTNRCRRRSPAGRKGVFEADGTPVKPIPKHQVKGKGKTDPPPSSQRSLTSTAAPSTAWQAAASVRLSRVSGRTAKGGGDSGAVDSRSLSGQDAIVGDNTGPDDDSSGRGRTPGAAGATDRPGGCTVRSTGRSRTQELRHRRRGARRRGRSRHAGRSRRSSRQALQDLRTHRRSHEKHLCDACHTQHKLLNPRDARAT